MTYEEVEKYYGSGYRIADKGGFSRGAPYNWKKQGFIPIETQMLIEKRTEGALKADLSHCKRRIEDETKPD